MTKTIFNFICCTMLLLSCKQKEVDEFILPEITSSGKNIMGFLYDDVVWKSVRITPGFFLTALTVDTVVSSEQFFDATNNTTTLQITGSMYVKDNDRNISANTNIKIWLRNFSQTTGQFYFDTIYNASNRIYFSDKLLGKNYANAHNSFQLTLTKFDTTNRIVSGHFSGTLYEFQSNVQDLRQEIFNFQNAMEIKDGRFDIKLQ